MGINSLHCSKLIGIFFFDAFVRDKIDRNLLHGNSQKEKYVTGVVREIFPLMLFIFYSEGLNIHSSTLLCIRM